MRYSKVTAAVVLIGLALPISGAALASGAPTHGVRPTSHLASTARLVSSMSGGSGIASAYLATDLGLTGQSIPPQVSRQGAYVMFDTYGSYSAGNPTELVYDVATGTSTTVSNFGIQGPGGNDRPLAINDSGDMAGVDPTTGFGELWTPGGGFSTPPNGPDTADYLMGEWKDGYPQDPPTPTLPGQYYAINDPGNVVGSKQIGCHAVTDDPPLPSQSSYPRCGVATEASIGGTVSPTGILVPSCSSDISFLVTEFCTAGQAIAINDAGTMASDTVPVGTSGGFSRGIYEWTAGSPPVAVLQGDNDELVALADSGDFLYLDHTSGNVCGPQWCLHDGTGSHPAMVGSVNGVAVSAGEGLGLNSAGVVAGNYQLPGGGASSYASLWTAATGIVDLSSRTTNLAAGALNYAYGIADNGSIVATGVNNHVYLLTPVPAISGQVANPDGSGASGVTVTATPTGGGSPLVGTTDTSGSYLIGAPADAYSVTVSAGIPAGDTVSPASSAVNTGSGDQTANFSFVPADTVSISSPLPVKDPPDGLSTILRFPVTLSSASSAPVTVDYATADGSAVAPGNYTATSGTLTFAPNQLTQSVTVTVASIVNPAVSIAFSVVLSNATGATLGNATAIGTILHGDAVDVVGVDPQGGPIKGGTTVTVSGSGFTDALGVPDVTFVSFFTAGFPNQKSLILPATSFRVLSGTLLQVVSPDARKALIAPGVVVAAHIIVDVGSAESSPSVNDEFTFGVAPRITGLSSSSGALAERETVTVYGHGFTGADTISLSPRGSGGAGYSIGIPPSTSDSEITVTLPDATHNPILVKYFDAAKATLNVDVTVDVPIVGGTVYVTSPLTAADRYTFVGPKVTSVSPGVVPIQAGATVTVSGSGFTGATSVQLEGGSGGLEAIALPPPPNDNSLTFTVPTNIGPVGGFPVNNRNQAVVDLTVIVEGIISPVTHSDRLTLQGPVVYSVVPLSGPLTGGNSVTINGVGFTGATGVSLEFGGGESFLYLPFASTDTAITVSMPDLSTDPEFLRYRNPKTHQLRVDIQVALANAGVASVSPVDWPDRYTFVG